MTDRCKHGLTPETCGLCTHHKFAGKLPPTGTKCSLQVMFGLRENQKRYYDPGDEMTKGEINRKLAIDVMGWRDIGGIWFYKVINTGYTVRQVHGMTWNPMENIEQALEVLEKFNFCWYIFRNSKGLFGCNILISGQDFVTSKWQKTPQEAICNAAILAIDPDEVKNG